VLLFLLISCSRPIGIGGEAGGGGRTISLLTLQIMDPIRFIELQGMKSYPYSRRYSLTVEELTRFLSEFSRLKEERQKTIEQDNTLINRSNQRLEKSNIKY